jgi:hypothetical protein
MKFERADISMINNVTEAEIITEFNKFGEEEDDFVVLSKNDMNYIQAALSDFEEEEGMLLEYQEGSLDKHFHAIDTNITKDQVLAAFLLYLKADASWKEQFSWEETVIEEDDL